VAQVFDGTEVTQNLTYDPFGEVQSGANENDLIYGYNAEEYNPVTDLQYLRARYYAPETGSFITEDSVLGSPSNLNSQNRYAYAENDPVNNFDPSGHSISNGKYEQAMESAGGINEIYNWSVDKTLQNSNQQFFDDALRNLSLVNDSKVTDFMGNVTSKAKAIGAVYGCTVGEVTNQAIKVFNEDVKEQQKTVNQRIQEEIVRQENDIYSFNLANQRYYSSMGMAASTIPWFDLDSWNQIHNEVVRDIKNGIFRVWRLINILVLVL
jgi:RHS repeat-associated protein